MNARSTDRDERLADSNAQAEWASNFAWGFAVLAALAAVFIWALSAR
jgi:hypothetical protein